MPSPCHSSAPLRAALVKVAETSFFAFTDPADPAERLDVAEWYTASVRFGGPFTGTVTVTLPVPLGHELACAFLGGEDVSDQIVRDLCGEFVNQVTGTWLTGLDDGVCFDLDGPVVTQTRARPGHGEILRVNDQPVIVHLA
jgi:CheY-specific phosphatase CheX